MAWGNIIEIIDINNSEVLEGKENRNFTIVGHFVSDSEIIFLAWISTNLLISVDSRKDIRVIYSGFLEGGFYDETRLGLNQGLNAVMDCQRLDSDLSFQTYLKDSQNRVRSCYMNTICCNSDTNTIIMIVKNLFYYCRI